MEGVCAGFDEGWDWNVERTENLCNYEVSEGIAGIDDKKYVKLCLDRPVESLEVCRELV